LLNNIIEYHGKSTMLIVVIVICWFFMFNNWTLRMLSVHLKVDEDQKWCDRSFALTSISYLHMASSKMIWHHQLLCRC